MSMTAHGKISRLNYRLAIFILGVWVCPDCLVLLKISSPTKLEYDPQESTHTPCEGCFIIRKCQLVVKRRS